MEIKMEIKIDSKNIPSIKTYRLINITRYYQMPSNSNTESKTESKTDGTPRLTITDEQGNSWIMNESYAELMKAYNFYHKEKERQRVKARRAYVPHPRQVAQPAQVVQVAVASPSSSSSSSSSSSDWVAPVPVTPVAPVPVAPKPTRKKAPKVEATPLEEKVANMDI